MTMTMTITNYEYMHEKGERPEGRSPLVCRAMAVARRQPPDGHFFTG